MASEEGDEILSDALYQLVTGPDSPAERSRADDKSAKRQRKTLIENIRSVIRSQNNGKDCLVSQHNEESFSYHGSLYNRTHPRLLNDIDVYVVLNGQGLSLHYCQQPEDDTPVPLLELFYGESRSQSGGGAMRHSTRGTRRYDPLASPSQARPMSWQIDESYGTVQRDDDEAIPVPFHKFGTGGMDPKRAKDWLHGIIETVLGGPGYSSSHGVKIDRHERGTRISGLGPRDRSYDIIPAFLVLEGNQHRHVIPTGRTLPPWEVVDTDYEKAVTSDLDRTYPASPEYKKLGYRQLVKLMKVISSHPQQKWKERYGITSTILERTLRDALQQRPPPPTRTSNLQILLRAVDKLTAVIQCGRYSCPGEVPIETRSPNPKFGGLNISAQWLKEEIII